MKTKYGNAKISASGHYQITSRKEGNHGKLLHRLIYEEYHGLKIPEGFDIHHLNHDKLDNDPLNLVMLPHGVHNAIHKLNEGASIVKAGMNRGKQNYRVIYQGKKLKRSVNKDKLVDYCINELGIDKEKIKVQTDELYKTEVS